MITTEEYIKYCCEENLKKEYNKNLLEKYPWLTLYTYNVSTGKLNKDLDYNYTRADDIPNGWRLAFGDQMIEELSQLLKKYNIEKEYCIIQIKEEFGGLRWYDNGFPKEGSKEYFNWLHKYEDLSFKTCIECGKPATRISKGWISPYCSDCINQDRSVPIEEFYK